MLSGIKILVIGASHLSTPGYLVDSLHDGLQKQGATVHSIGVCGTTPAAWVSEANGKCGGAERIGTGPMRLSINYSAKTKAISQLVQTEHPNLVVVVMGDTLAGYKQPYFDKQWASLEVHKLTTALTQLKVRCIWIGPAWGNDGGLSDKTQLRVRQVSEFLASNVEPCSYVNSLSMAKPGEWRTVDGQHFDAAGYKSWGAAITLAITQLAEAH